MELPELWAKLKPLVVSVAQQVAAAGTGFAPTPHALSSTHHTGTLIDAQAPQFLKTDGTRQLTGNLSVASGVTIDGVDLSAHASNADAHHTAFVGLRDGNDDVATPAADDTVTLAVAGSWLATTAAGNTLTITLTPRSVVAGNGLSGGGSLSSDVTLSLSTPGTLSASSSNSASGAHTHAVTASSAPGATVSLLKTDANGSLSLARLDVGSGLLRINEGGNGRIGINCAPDAQFVLDVAGNIRSQGWIVGKHAIQLDGALLIAHMDGAGGTTDVSGSAMGHKGQPATLSGGVLFRPGKFGKALQCSTAITNLCVNPSFETNTTGWAANSSSVLSRVTTEAYLGGACLLTVSGGGQSYAQAVLTNISITNQTYYWSVYAKNRDLPAGGSVQLLVYWQGGAQAAAFTTVTLALTTSTLTDWTRLFTAFTPDYADRTTASFYVRCNGATADGQGVYVDAAQLATTPAPYADGSLGTGHSWSGTAHASTSSRTAAYASYPASGNVHPTHGTLMAWIEIPPDNNAINTVLHLRNGSADGVALYVRHDQSNSPIQWYWYAAGAAQVVIGPSAAGMSGWHHVAATYERRSAGTHIQRLYVDGVAYGNATGALFPDLSAATTLYVGALAGSSGYANGLIDDLVTVERVLSADEIRAIYESNAPVFAETSTFSWSNPATTVWVDARGLFGRTSPLSGASYDALAFATQSLSWGGKSLSAGDLLLGNTSRTWLHFDATGGGVQLGGSGGAPSLSLDSAGNATFRGTLTTADNGITLDTSGMTFATGAATNQAITWPSMEIRPDPTTDDMSMILEATGITPTTGKGAVGLLARWATSNANYLSFAIDPNGGAVLSRVSIDKAVTADLNLVHGVLKIANTQVLGTRKTGWGTPSGTLTRTTFDSATVTTTQLAQRVAALITDLISHGALGA